METRIFGEGKLGAYNRVELSETRRSGGAQARSHSRRSSLEISMDVLRAVSEGCLRPTQIMYKANLSWSLLTAHLRQLVKYEILLEQRAKTRLTYALTERGINVLRSYTLVVEQFEQFELDLEASRKGQPSASIFTR